MVAGLGGSGDGVAGAGWRDDVFDHLGPVSIIVLLYDGDR
jgi:hypothetical protein